VPTIRQLSEQVSRGQIRIPKFQRGFVWDPDQVAFFLDSLYKGYPVGTLLFWRTKQALQSERSLGPFTLPEVEPDYPIDYVLDGQQRLTSIYGSFLPDPMPEEAEWHDIYFDLHADSDAQEPQFVALPPELVDNVRHFPMRVLFDPIQYRRATAPFDEHTIIRLDEMQTKFKEVQIPIQVTSTEDRASVAIIFERINRTGVPLDTLQLLSAWTWSEEFALQDRFDELKEELEPFGFNEVGEDANLLLRCCSAIISGDAAPSALMSLSGSEVRERFDELLNGVRGAVDFLKNNLGIVNLRNLPYATILVPLSVFFAIDGNKMFVMNSHQREFLERWFWRCCFGKRYSSGVLRNLKTDIDEIVNLRQGNPSRLGDFPVGLSPFHFIFNTFRVGSVNTDTFVLMLAQNQPKSFISGNPISLRSVLKDYNRNEFHHLYPRHFLKTNNNASPSFVNSLANFAFMSKSENIKLGGASPSSYRKHLPTAVSPILESAFCPPSLFRDDFGQFLSERNALLIAEAKRLMDI
jgi:hypothetical protein